MPDNETLAFLLVTATPQVPYLLELYILDAVRLSCLWLHQTLCFLFFLYRGHQLFGFLCITTMMEYCGYHCQHT